MDESSLVTEAADLQLDAVIQKKEEIIERVSELQRAQFNKLQAINKDVMGVAKELAEIQLRQRKYRIFNVGRPVRVFVGRTKELETIKAQLDTGTNCVTLSQATSISGLGGIGKTQLAKMFAYTYFTKEDYNAVWVDADNEKSIERSFRTAAELLQISPKKSIGQCCTLDMARDVYECLDGQKTLLIFDNADNYDIIRDILPWAIFPNRRSPYVLITSRNSNWDVGRQCKMFVQELKEFSRDEAFQYIKQYLKISPEDTTTDGDIDVLIETQMFFPLALSHAAAFIRMSKLKSPNYTIRNYLDMFGEQHKKIPLWNFKEKYDAYTMTLYTTWQMTFEAIQKEGETGRRALDFINTMALLAPDYILVERFFIKRRRDEEEVWEAFELLDQYSIIKLNEGKATIHRLVQVILRLWIRERKETENYLKKVLQINFMWDFYEQAFSHNHIMEFLRLAFSFDAITLKYHDKEKAVSYYIKRYLREHEMQTVTEKKILSSDHIQYTEVYTVVIDTRHGLFNILKFLEPVEWIFKILPSLLVTWGSDTFVYLRSYVGNIDHLPMTDQLQKDDAKIFQVYPDWDEHSMKHFLENYRKFAEGVVHCVDLKRLRYPNTKRYYIKVRV